MRSGNTTSGAERKNPHDRRPERLAWLKANRELWFSLSLNEAKRRQLVMAMKRDGLLSKSTYWKDVNLANLIEEVSRPTQ